MAQATSWTARFRHGPTTENEFEDEYERANAERRAKKKKWKLICNFFDISVKCFHGNGSREKRVGGVSVAVKSPPENGTKLNNTSRRTISNFISFRLFSLENCRRRFSLDSYQSSWVNSLIFLLERNCMRFRLFFLLFLFCFLLFQQILFLLFDGFFKCASCMDLPCHLRRAAEASAAAVTVESFQWHTHMRARMLYAFQQRCTWRLTHQMTQKKWPIRMHEHLISAQTIHKFDGPAIFYWHCGTNNVYQFIGGAHITTESNAKTKQTQTFKDRLRRKEQHNIWLNSQTHTYTHNVKRESVCGVVAILEHRITEYMLR